MTEYLSHELFREARELMPGGVNSPVRACRNVDAEPIFIDRAKGAYLFDVDGNEYLDFVMSWGPLLLGHADPDVTAAIKAAVARGSSFGAPCPAEVALARLVTEAVPGVEMLRMVNSGTEAAMSAVRLARGVTGRDKIVKFIGCYHGHGDSFLAAAGSGVATFSLPGTPGVTDAVAGDTLLAEYNDLDAVAELFKAWGENIAAIIVEPVAANMGLVLPSPGFLEGLRKLADSYGALLIFDEVITGFRAAFGGAQARFGIKPDLSVFGKIIGGGLPVGCFGGKRELMVKIAPEGDIYQAGTLSGNPLAMAAGIATLQKLRCLEYDALESRVAAFCRELSSIMAEKGIPAQIPAFASMFAIFFTTEPVNDFRDAKKCDQKLYAKFYRQMRQRGIYLAPSAFETGMCSFAHTKADFARTLEVARETEL